MGTHDQMRQNIVLTTCNAVIIIVKQINLLCIQVAAVDVPNQISPRNLIRRISDLKIKILLIGRQDGSLKKKRPEKIDRHVFQNNILTVFDCNRREFAIE